METPHVIIKQVSELTRDELEEAFALFTQTFEDVSIDFFLNYMAEYHHFSSYRHPSSHHLIGFAPCKLEKITIEEEPFWIFSSGHTLISPKYRSMGQKCVGFALGYYISYFWETISNPNNVYYWMMSEGVASYLWLKNNFPEFYPSFEAKTPKKEQTVIDFLGKEIGKEWWRQETGICIYTPGEGLLKSRDNEEQTLASLCGKNKAHAHFYFKRNPGHGRDYLCALGVVNPDYFARWVASYGPRCYPLSASLKAKL